MIRKTKITVYLATVLLAGLSSNLYSQTTPPGGGRGTSGSDCKCGPSGVGSASFSWSVVVTPPHPENHAGGEGGTAKLNSGNGSGWMAARSTDNGFRTSQIRSGEIVQIGSICAGKPVRGTLNGYQCTAGCLPQFQVRLTPPGNLLLVGGPQNNTFSFSPAVPGLYTLVVTSNCMSLQCESSVYKVNIQKIER